MHPELEQLRCVIMRAGTSKGIFIMKNELPSHPEKRNAVIRAIFGSPDVRQIDGLGGADVLTSKLAIISPSSRSDADIDYTFAQVSFESDVVDYKGNCGNISSGVGPFAIDEGLIQAVEPITTVRIHQTNIGKIITAQVPVVNGKAAVDGSLRIDGVPGTGSCITLDFSDTQGSITGKLLPTGNPKNCFEFNGKSYEVSIIDAGNPLVFIKAADLGIKGIEEPNEIEANVSLMQTIEGIRGKVAEYLGLCEDWNLSVSESPYIPFFAIVGPPQNYKTFNGKNVNKENIDMTSWLLFMQRMHKTYPGSGTCCTGAAARIKGSIVWEVLRAEAKKRARINIGHPSGIIAVESAVKVEEGEIKLTKAAFYRTARRIMEGYVYVRKQIFSD
ncbi:MAG: 2-methylaconitate cis-trans isomerase PrpF family protein [Peptococcaceae bacterium]